MSDNLSLSYVEQIWFAVGLMHVGSLELKIVSLSLCIFPLKGSIFTLAHRKSLRKTNSCHLPKRIMKSTVCTILCERLRIGTIETRGLKIRVQRIIMSLELYWNNLKKNDSNSKQSKNNPNHLPNQSALLTHPSLRINPLLFASNSQPHLLPCLAKNIWNFFN